MDIRFGTWNERLLYMAVSLMTVAKETSKYKWEYRKSGGTEVAPNQQANIHFLWKGE
jgi:hypothetical protein